jgi:Bor protein
MHRIVKLSLSALLVAGLACYHATVDTGLTPSTVTVEKSFAPAWIDGLIPPSTVETASKCPNGAAKVETQLSFVNMLVGLITLSIFTPMDIKVTCAQARHASLPNTAPAIDVGANATAEQIRDAIGRAAEMSLRTGEPVYVEY